MIFAAGNRRKNISARYFSQPNGVVALTICDDIDRCYSHCANYDISERDQATETNKMANLQPNGTNLGSFRVICGLTI